jgi:uncharacterized protein (TIGR02145 family)/uncharacterized repeat protein (TIGR02543 family)
MSAGTGGTITAPTGSPPVTVTYGVPTTIIAAPNTGYSFGSWTITTGTASIVSVTSASTTVSLTSVNATIAASFNPMTYQVNFDAQGGDNLNPVSTSVTYASTYGTLATTGRSGYIFEGWWTGIGGTGSKITSTSIVAITTNQILYAKWDIKDYDGNVYTAVKIGTQTWLVENLKTTHFNNGDEITLETDNSLWTSRGTAEFCWFNNDNVANKTPYGALYNWHAVHIPILAPIGWHVPTDAEWTTLSTYLSGDAVAGGKLKEKGLDHWASPNSGANNDYGFSALGGGVRSEYGSFIQQLNWCSFWSATESASDSYMARYRYLDYNSKAFSSYEYYKSCGFSVRLIKD